MTKSVEEMKLAKAAKAKAARVLKAEQRDQAMIALSEKRYKLLGEDAIVRGLLSASGWDTKECMAQFPHIGLKSLTGSPPAKHPLENVQGLQTSHSLLLEDESHQYSPS
jgi:hypothetical protein